MADVVLIGGDTSHSASPAMHNAAFAALGLPHRYRLIDVSAENVPSVVEAIRRGEILAANVTTPHKGLVARLVDDLDPDAASAGAVNTIVRRNDRLLGANTDLAALADAVASLRPRTIRHAVVLGSGGVSRAARVALQRSGALRQTTISRHPAPGEVDWKDLADVLDDADLIINATPVGAGTQESPVPPTLLRRDLAVLDLVYRPSPTRLIRDARAAGAVARSGATVLLGQGWRSFEAWTGCAPPVAVMAAALREELGGHDEL